MRDQTSCIGPLPIGPSSNTWRGLFLRERSNHDAVRTTRLERTPSDEIAWPQYRFCRCSRIGPQPAERRRRSIRIRLLPPISFAFFPTLCASTSLDTISKRVSISGPPMSASLIGRLRSSAFRLSTTAVSMSLTGSCFSSESAPGPFHHGIRGRGGTIFGSALPLDKRQVQADMRTHLIHRPARDIIPPLGGARVSSYRV